MAISNVTFVDVILLGVLLGLNFTWLSVKGHAMDICTSVLEDVQKEDYLVIGGSNKKLKRVHQVQAILKRVKPLCVQYRKTYAMPPIQGCEVKKIRVQCTNCLPDFL